MPLRGLAVLTLALLIGVVGGACTPPTAAEAPNEAPRIDAGEQVDAAAVCTAGCERLERCVPELAGDIDGDPAAVAERLAGECRPACGSFTNARSALAVRDCLSLSSCTAFWACVGAAPARPWLAAVAPVGERTCQNLCSQASACAVAKVCEAEAGARKPRPGKASRPSGDPDRDEHESGSANEAVDGDCARDELLRSALDERCVLQCQTLAQDSRARFELIGCIDHGSCDGLLGCLDGWAATSYEQPSGPTPGISPTCDSFCTRAIVCGAADEQLELEPHELEQLKQTMTSTYVECAVQCAHDLETGGDAARDTFEACTAVETCELFSTCADEV